MQDAFHVGGWGMYPTMVFGLIMVAAAIQFARDPERRKRAVVRSLGMLVALSGALGFVAGVIALIGVSESAYNLGLALCLLVVARIFVTIGTMRGASGRADLADPHQPG